MPVCGETGHTVGHTVGFFTEKQNGAPAAHFVPLFMTCSNQVLFTNLFFKKIKFCQVFHVLGLHF